MTELLERRRVEYYPSSRFNAVLPPKVEPEPVVLPPWHLLDVDTDEVKRLLTANPLFDTIDQYHEFLVEFIGDWLSSHYGSGGNGIPAYIHWIFDNDDDTDYYICSFSDSLYGSEDVCEWEEDELHLQYPEQADDHHHYTPDWEEWWEHMEESFKSRRPNGYTVWHLPDWWEKRVNWMSWEDKVAAIVEYSDDTDAELGEGEPIYEMAKAYIELTTYKGTDLLVAMLAATAVQHYNGLLFGHEDDGGRVDEEQADFVDRVRNEGPSSVWGEDHVREWLERHGG